MNRRRSIEVSLIEIIIVHCAKQQHTGTYDSNHKKIQIQICLQKKLKTTKLQSY